MFKSKHVDCGNILQYCKIFQLSIRGCGIKKCYRKLYKKYKKHYFNLHFNQKNY